MMCPQQTQASWQRLLEPTGPAEPICVLALQYCMLHSTFVFESHFTINFLLLHGLPCYTEHNTNAVQPRVLALGVRGQQDDMQQTKHHRQQFALLVQIRKA